LGPRAGPEAVEEKRTLFLPRIEPAVLSHATKLGGVGKNHYLYPTIAVTPKYFGAATGL